MIVAGDIGGTKTRLALFISQSKTGEYDFSHLATYPSQEYPDLKSIVLQFLAECPSSLKPIKVHSAAFAIAGPVQKGVAKTTNLPWIVNSNSLAETCNIPHVYLLNDLEANAYGVEILSQKNLEILYPGSATAVGNRGVCSPGTGLGQAGLYWDGTHYHPFACEGGHCEFGPRNALEIELCQYIIGRFGHSSYERILSGPGIHTVYSFFKDVKKVEEPSWLKDQLQQEDPSKTISDAAIAGSAEICTLTLDMFVSVFGAESGNLALKFMATGGIYLGGGIPPKILPKLKEPLFFQSFVSKGRLHTLLEEIPISVILDDKAALKGAAHYCYLQTQIQRMQ